jgi:glycosyltransferase involved in cell wall biosynthesis
MQNKKMQNKNPTASVLTTVYNREKYIAACIESVLASTYKDWELIIVDDQSKDRSVAIAQEYAARDARIKVYVNEKNLGDYPNRNQAAAYAKGKYLKYLDADDLIYPHGLQIMVETMEAHPECALGISQEVAEDLKPYPFVMTPQETFRREFLQRGVLGLGPTGTIIRRDAFERLGGFTGTRYIGDTEMWYQLAMSYPVVKMVPGLTFWRQHDEQQIVMEKQDFKIIGIRFLHSIATLKDPNLPLSQTEKDIALQKVRRRFARQLLRLLKQGQVQIATSIAQRCQVSWVKILLWA